MKTMTREELIHFPSSIKVLKVSIQIMPRGIEVESRIVKVSQREGRTPASDCNMIVDDSSIKHVRFFESDEFDPIVFDSAAHMYCLPENEGKAIEALKTALMEKVSASREWYHSKAIEYDNMLRILVEDDLNV